ncbi:MAG: class I adenylate-forming enzyme family protein [Nocardioidaceae bacterium]
MVTGYRYDPTAFKEVFERHFTYLAGFERNVHRYESSPALSDLATGRSWTYAELGADVDRLAAGFFASGLRPGDVVVFQLYNSPEFALTWLACQRLAVTATPINFRLSPGESAYILDDSRPQMFVYDATLAGPVAEALSMAAHRPPRLVAVGRPGDGESGAPEPVASFSDLLTADHPAPPWPDQLRCFDESTRLYTSGTTGMPKGVSLNSAVEVLTAHDVIMHFPLGPQDKTLNMTPWFHRGGLYSGGPNPTFYVGAEAVAMRTFDPAGVLDAVVTHGLTFLIGAPTNLNLLAHAQESQPRDLSTLRGIVTMGAPLERQACLRYQEVLTPNIFNGYGTTEAFWNTFLRPADLPEHAGTAGRACTDDDVAVVKVYPDRAADPSDRVSKNGTEVGEVIVRSVKSGYRYVNQPEEEAGRFHDGWLYIGDLATWDEDEYVTIVGRKDDMIISGGENVHPVQVEETLNSMPGVLDSLVVGMPDDRWGEVVVAYVRRADDVVTAEACDAYCRAHPMLADFKRPRTYRFVDELPMTATGKKMHFRLRNQVAADSEAGLLERP